MHTLFTNIHARFDIIPEFSKTKTLKLILDIDDIHMVTGFDFNEGNCLNITDIQTMGYRLSQKLLCYKEMNAYRLSIPIENIC